MTLGQINADGVRAAIREFDDRGRQEFLDRYGYGQATSFFVELNGKHYDSKAIAGVAHKYSVPGSAPLLPADFSGGESTVAAALTRLGFTVVNRRPRNPDWTRDELILALDFYRTHRDRLPDKASAAIAQLSDEIGAVAKALNLAGGETLRNPNGVYMKLMNLRRFDPAFLERGGAGLSRGGAGEEEVWEYYWQRPNALEAAAQAIREALRHASPGSQALDELRGEPEPDIEEAMEGAIATRIHRSRERNRKIVERKKAAALRTTGKLECEVCGFDYEARYGERGRGYIECHHVAAISEIVGERQTRLSDLALICANCHRMIHASRPWLTLDALRALALRQN